jgi:hypothetical protein
MGLEGLGVERKSWNGKGGIGGLEEELEWEEEGLGD